jgi:hypothetical protein
VRTRAFLWLVSVGTLPLVGCSEPADFGSPPLVVVEPASWTADESSVRDVSQPLTCCTSQSDDHLQAVHRQRRIIVNNDGNDTFDKLRPNGCNTQAAQASEARELLWSNHLRALGLNDKDTTGNAVNQVDTVVYETSGGGFGRYHHRTQIGEQIVRHKFFCEHANSGTEKAINRDFCGRDDFDVADCLACPAGGSTCTPALAECQDRCLAKTCEDECVARGGTFAFRYALSKWVDPLQETINYLRGSSGEVERPREVFWGIRMNDTHDAAHTANWYHLLFSDFKQQQVANLNLSDCNDQPPHLAHPGVLFAANSDGLVPCYRKASERAGLPLLAGRWSGVAYDTSVVRNFASGIVNEVLTNYDVDGIQLNFMRHAIFFRGTAWWGRDATSSEIGDMNSMMAGIRAITDAAAARIGHPVLISVLVPDSTTYAKKIGLDLETWVREHYVDLIVGGDYQQLRRFSEPVNEVASWQGDLEPAERRVLFVAGFTESRQPVPAGESDLRHTAEAIRGKALEAWAAGAASIQISNAKYEAATYSQVGDRYTASGDDPPLASGSDVGKDLLQFGSLMGYGDNPGKSPAYDRYFSSYYAQIRNDQAQLGTPDAPWDLEAGAQKRWEFNLGRGKKQRMFYVYVRTTGVSLAQRAGQFHVQVDNPTLGVVQIPHNGFWSAKKLMRFHLEDVELAEDLLSVPTLKVDVINDSSSPVSITDVYVHATLANSRPGLLGEIHCYKTDECPE